MYRRGNMVSAVVEEFIFNILKSAEHSLTIQDVAKRGNINRITAAKYLEVLEARGHIKHREVGKAKLYSLVKK
jgi:predicted transcriptional regulator